jgi:hypothetical protein
MLHSFFKERFVLLLLESLLLLGYFSSRIAATR